MISTKPLRFRQIHLDFHTSEKIPGVGSRFSRENFGEMLKRGHVDSITIFSKCHHGMSYHDTQVGVRHPHLENELMTEQLEMCRAHNVKAPIYLSAGWDEAMAHAHPEWISRDIEGKNISAAPLAAYWKMMCFNTPYLDYLCAQIEEVTQKFGADDGIFLDIIALHRCYCTTCLTGMQADGLNPAIEADADEYAARVLAKYYERATASSLMGNPQRRVFHNSGHIAKGDYDRMKWNTHLELESLPTGGWGYDHFPLSAKYVATTGYDFLGMTGKFHTTWGEFGGFKRAAALQYECAAMLAFGAKCSIGDQLHPSGEMNADTYNLIGAAYAEVEAKEAWCENVRAVSDIALISGEAWSLAHGAHASHTSTPHGEEGAARMLLELHQSFDVVDFTRDLSGYKVVILPDIITLEGEFGDKIKQFAQNGGKVLMSSASGMNADKTAFFLDAGLDIVGRSEWNPDYICPTDATPTSPVRDRFVIHGGAFDVRAKHGTRVLANRAAPYFNRAWDHFCSHQHTPDATHNEFPAVTQHDNIIYFAHAIFTRYRLYGQPLYRDLVQDALNILLEKPVVEIENFPRAGRVSLQQQEGESRYVLHLLYAVPATRGGAGSGDNVGQPIEIIEDLVPLFDVKCRVRVPEIVKSARLVPGGEEVEISREDGAVAFTVPRLLCHQMIELGY